MRSPKSASGPAMLGFRDGRQPKVEATVLISYSFSSVYGDGEFVTDRITALSLCECDGPLVTELQSGSKAHIVVHEVRTNAHEGRC